MKIVEKFNSENSRYHVFRIIYGLLFFVLFIFIIKLQIVESVKFEEKERKQGQRRILHPGARGDVFDREGRLLIGNTAQFSAVIHLDELKSEIWKKKVELKKDAFRIRKELSKLDNITLTKLINFCSKEDIIKERFISL